MGGPTVLSPMSTIVVLLCFLLVGSLFPAVLFSLFFSFLLCKAARGNLEDDLDKITEGTEKPDETPPPDATEITTLVPSTSSSASFFPPADDVVVAGDAFVGGASTVTVKTLSVAGKLTVQGGLVVVPDTRPSMQALDITGTYATAGSAMATVQGLLNISAGANLLVIVDSPPPPEPTTISINVFTFAQREGSFRAVLLDASDPCMRAQNPTAAYAASGLSVAVQIESSCNGGLPKAALIGIIAGAALAGVLLVVAIIIVSVKLRRRHTQQANRKLAHQDISYVPLQNKM